MLHPFYCPYLWNQSIIVLSQFLTVQLLLIFKGGAIIHVCVGGEVVETMNSCSTPSFLGGSWLGRDPKFCLILSLWEETYPTHSYNWVGSCRFVDLLNPGIQYQQGSYLHSLISPLSAMKVTLQPSSILFSYIIIGLQTIRQRSFHQSSSNNSKEVLTNHC